VNSDKAVVSCPTFGQASQEGLTVPFTVIPVEPVAAVSSEFVARI
jgi:hypothetical protein